MAAFVLRIPKDRGSALPSAPAAGTGDLGFQPGRSVVWTSAGGGPVLTFWTGADDDDGEGVAAAEGGVAFAVGDPYLGTSVSGSGPGVVACVAGDDHSPASSARMLRGTYVAGHLDRAGTGWVATDALGLRCLYVGEDDAQVVVGSRAALVAAAIARPGTAPAKDLAATSCLAHTTFWSGAATGYVGVRAAPPGTYLEIGATGTRWRPGILARALASSSGDLPAAAVAPEVVADVADGLLAVLRQATDRPVLQLTGGRDARMLLAVALEAGIAREFHYQTAGPDELADVRIARALAARYGLSHETLFIGMRSAAPYGPERRRWVCGVGGMVSAWEAPGRTMPDVRVTGVGGELLRSFHRGISCTDGSPAQARVRFGRLGLVRPDVAEGHQESLWAPLAEQLGGRSDPFVETHLYYALNRMRFTRLGPRSEVLAERRRYPLYSPTLVACAFSVDPEERQSDLVCLEVLRRCAPELVELEFAGSSWDERARRAIGSDQAVDRPAGPPSPATTEVRPTPGPSSLVAGLFAESTDERADLVREVLGEVGNPIWEVLDRRRTVDAAERWAELGLVERREVFGAVSAAIWAAHEGGRAADPTSGPAKEGAGVAVQGGGQGGVAVAGVG